MLGNVSKTTTTENAAPSSSASPVSQTSKRQRSEVGPTLQELAQESGLQGSGVVWDPNGTHISYVLPRSVESPSANSMRAYELQEPREIYHASDLLDGIADANQRNLAKKSLFLTCANEFKRCIQGDDISRYNCIRLTLGMRHIIGQIADEDIRRELFDALSVIKEECKPQFDELRQMIDGVWTHRQMLSQADGTVASLGGALEGLLWSLNKPLSGEQKQ